MRSFSSLVKVINLNVKEWNRKEGKEKREKKWKENI